MYILDFLAGSLTGEGTSEYRLLCSGELYSGNVITFDWRKSDATRRLLIEPFALRVVSQPFHTYPQELALEFGCIDSVTESSRNSVLSLRPDDEIAKDLAVLLTLLTRRLVVVYTKVRVRYPRNPYIGYNEETGPYEVAWPIADTGPRVSWERKPFSVITGGDGVRKIIDNNPPAFAVDREVLSSKLTVLPKLPDAESFVSAARLYSQALRLVEEWPEIAYQLLVYSVETLANSVFADYVPTRPELISEKRQVSDQAQSIGVSRDNAEELAVLACKGIPWAARKFRMFLNATTDESLWTQDDMYPQLSEHWLPKRDGFNQVLKDIYSGRSQAVHRGQSFGGPGVAIGTTYGIPVRAAMELFSGTPPKVPPVCWFERVVNLALNRYLELSGNLSVPSTATPATHPT